MAERADNTTARIVRECEGRIAARLAEVKEADAAGRLFEAVKDTPSVAEQLREIAAFRKTIS